MKITEVNYRKGTGTDLMVRVMPFETTATSCQLYYEIKSEAGERMEEGNLSLTEEEFTAWGESNVYIEDLALEKLNLERDDTADSE